MATKKKTTKKRSIVHRATIGSVQKIHRIVSENVTVSIMMVSLLLNVFFLTGLVLYQTSDRLETSVFTYTLNHFCDDRKGNQSLDIQQYEVTCAEGQFRPFYEKALTDYDDQMTRQNY